MHSDAIRTNELSGQTTIPLWAGSLFVLALIFPLIELPRPALLTTPPWKVELLTSALLIPILIYRKLSLGRGLTLFSQENALAYALRGMLLFAAWSGASLVWSAASGAAVHHSLVWSVYLVFLILETGLASNEDGIDSIAKLGAILAVILGFICLIDYATLIDFSVSEGALRIRWAKYAELLITISPLLWVYAFSGQIRGRGLFVAGALLGWLTAMLSLSKAAFISGVIAFVILFIGQMLVCPNRQRRMAILSASLWLIFTVAVQVTFTVFSPVPSTAQYFSGSADSTRSTSSMRVFTWKVTGEMIREDPVLGVGADNFGSRFNDGRVLYAESHPEDPDIAIGEDYLFERAHNEYLQIFAELGIVGFALFVGAFSAFGYWVIRRLLLDKGHLQPLAVAALAGMIGFAVSSLFTSFSFRAFQNGLAFFAMMAVVIVGLSKRGDKGGNEDPPDLKPNRIWRLTCFSILATMAAFSGCVAASQILATMGERQADAGRAQNYFGLSLTFFPENGGAQLAYSSRAASQGRYGEAARLVESSIQNGTGASVTYARLADLYLDAGDTAAAEGGLKRGIRVFPRSLYLRARLAVLLERAGRSEDSRAELEAARAIDLRQANGWYAIITKGSSDAYQISRNDPTVAGPAELLPSNAVYPYLDEKMGSADPQQ